MLRAAPVASNLDAAGQNRNATGARTMMVRASSSAWVVPTGTYGYATLNSISLRLQKVLSASRIGDLIHTPFDGHIAN